MTQVTLNIKDNSKVHFFMELLNNFSFIEIGTTKPQLEEEIVAYSTDGKPLTVKTYNKALEKAEQDILNGRVISSDELKEEVKSWRK